MEIREGHLEAIKEKFDAKGTDWAFTAVMHGSKFTLGVAERDIKGYSPLDYFYQADTYDEASEYATKLNTERGLDVKDAFTITASSMKF